MGKSWEPLVWMMLVVKVLLCVLQTTLFFVCVLSVVLYNTVISFTCDS